MPVQNSARWGVYVLLFLSFVINSSFYLPVNDPDKNPYLLVLGIAQDGGYPQSGCKKDCCKKAWEDVAIRRSVSCLALIDPVSQQRWIFDATPDLREQLHKLNESAQLKADISGIFLTHAHIGHYAGLMNLGREVMGTKGVPVYAMPRMSQFLAKNGPWSQLVTLNNIVLTSLHNDSTIQLNSRLSVTPFLVPHRDEFSETVGFKISAPNKSVIFIPDIDKWEKWSTSILDMVKKTDALFIDGTFFENGELPGVDMSKIPHPFVFESMELFRSLSATEKAKIHFIHFNHSNPLLREESEQYKQVIKAGFNIAKEMQALEL